MQPSLIKLLNELLAEFVDPTLESNSDIVGKSVAILKQLAQFINEQKRNEERSLEKEKAHDEEIKQDPVQADLPMAEQENNESS